MANVVVTVRILPEGLEVDLNSIKAEARKAGATRLEEKPVAFGLKAVEAVFSIPDAEGGSEILEKQLRAIPGVSSAEIIGLAREITTKDVAFDPQK